MREALSATRHAIAKAQRVTEHSSAEQGELKKVKKLLLDFGPLALFFIGYRSGDLMMATAMLVGGTLISLAYTYATEKKIHTAPLASGILVAVFGGLTLALNDELFIKRKGQVSD